MGQSPGFCSAMQVHETTLRTNGFVLLGYIYIYLYLIIYIYIGGYNIYIYVILWRPINGYIMDLPLFK